MKKPLALSLIIPAYNEERHLRACLDAVACQTVMPLEVIVVDNNSTDNTVAVAESYPFVTVVHESAQGILAARNAGFNVAQGDIIGRVDSDTVIVPNWVEHVIELFNDDHVAAVTGPQYFYDMPLQEDNFMAEHLIKKSLYKLDRKFPFLAGGNMAIRTSVWHKVKDETCHAKSIHEDIDLAIHLRKHRYKIVYDAKIRSGTSSRRFDDPPLKFTKYITMMTRTFRHHDISPPVGAHLAVIMYSLGYVSLWPLRRSYNPETGKRTIRQLVRGHAARKNPMSSQV